MCFCMYIKKGAASETAYFSQFKINPEMYTYLAAVLKDGECIKTGQASNLENILPKIGSV